MFLLGVSVVALLSALLVSALLTWLVRSIATKHRWVRGPESDRHVHKLPVPRLGGVAVYLTFTILVVCETAFINYGLHLPQAESTRLLLRILLPATLLFLVGLIDDLWSVHPLGKLTGQIAAGLWLWELGCRVCVPVVHLNGTDCSRILSLFATVAWVVMLSNAFNLIDGLDGLAAGASVFPLVTFAAAALFHHNGQLATASLILTGALLGFLRFNFNPASIFLGDCGSLFLGFLLSAFSLAGEQVKAPTLLSVALPVVACGLPIAETCVSVLRRFLGGRPIFSPDREHFHHRLLKLGFTHRQVVVLLFGVSGLCSLLGIFLLYPKLNVLLLVITTLLMLGVVGIGKLRYPEFAEIGRVWLRVREQKSVIAQNVKIRQMAALLENSADFDYAVGVLQKGFEDGDFSGFKLRVHELAGNEYRGGKGALVFSRSIVLRQEYEPFSWNLTMEFFGASYSGQLELQCPYTEQSLMVDINVLLQVLTPALCKLCRNTKREKRFFEIPTQAIAKGASVGD